MYDLLKDFRERFFHAITDVYVADLSVWFIQPNPNVHLGQLSEHIHQYILNQQVHFNYYFVSKIPYIDGQVHQDLLMDSIHSLGDEKISEQTTKACMQRHFVSIDSDYYYSQFSSVHSELNVGPLFHEETGYSIIHGENLDESICHKTLGAMLLDTVKVDPYKSVHFINDDNLQMSISYEALLHRAKYCLGNLIHSGIRSKDTLIFCLDGSVELIVLCWACFLGGIVVLPVPALSDLSGEFGFLKHLLYLRDELGQLNIVANLNDLNMIDEYVRKIHDKTPVLPEINTFESNEEHRHDVAVTVNMLLLDDLLVHKRQAVIPEVEPEQFLLMLMTSGSTGKPKLVVHTHKSIIARTWSHIIYNRCTSTDVSLNWFGFDHVGALVMYHIHDVILGTDQLHVKKQYILQEPLNWLKLLDEYQVTVTWAPNFAFALLLHELELHQAFQADLSHIRCFINAGETINYDIAKRALDILSLRCKLNKYVIRTAWGMSETASGVTYSHTLMPCHANNGLVYTSLGFPIPGCSIRIALKHGHIAALGIPGSLQINSLTLMKGYLHDLNRNKSSFLDDGWFDTGDIACLTQQGLVVLGRDRDILIINGVNYSIVELATSMMFSSDIIPGCLCILPFFNQYSGTHELVIFATPKHQDQWHMVCAHIRSTLGSRVGLTPTHIIQISSEKFPRTTIGKIKKMELQTRFLAGEYTASIIQDDLNYHYKHTVGGICVKQWILLPKDHFIKPSSLGKSLIVLEDTEQNKLMNLLNYIQSQSSFVVIYSTTSLFSMLDTMTNESWMFDAVFYIDTDCMALDMNVFDYFRKSFNFLYCFAQKVNSYIQQKLSIHYIRVVTCNLDNLDADYIATTKFAFFKSFAKENNKISLKMSYVDRQDLLNEKPKNEQWYCFEKIIYLNLNSIGYFCDQSVYVASFMQIDPMLHIDNTCHFSHANFHVVIGGFGGIGYALAKLLVQKGIKHLLILGRRTPDEIEQYEVLLTSLSIKEVHVVYEPVDICDLKSLSHIMCIYAQRFAKPLGKIFNTAGLYESKYIQDESIQHVMQQLFPKVIGSLNLLEICMQNDGAELILFSSVNGFFGGASVSAYAIANAFQDALAGSHFPVKTLAWSMWENLRLSKMVGDDALTKLSGYEVLSQLQGLFAFLYCMSLPEKHVLIGLNCQNRYISQLVNNNVYQLTYAKDYPTASNYQEQFLKTTCVKLPNGLDYHWHEVIHSLKTIWMHVLNIVEIDEEDNFFDIGGRSLLVPKIQAKIKQIYNITLPAIAIFKFPTIQLLAEHLISEYGDGVI